MGRLRPPQTFSRAAGAWAMLAEAMTGLERIQRLLLRVLAAVLLAAVVVYIADTVTFRVRLAHGNGIQSQPVDQFLQTPLKGGKMELDYLGTASQSCAAAMLPQYVSGTWMTPCWWLKRHSNQWQ